MISPQKGQPIDSYVALSQKGLDADQKEKYQKTKPAPNAFVDEWSFTRVGLPRVVNSIISILCGFLDGRTFSRTLVEKHVRNNEKRKRKTKNSITQNSEDTF